MDEDFMRGQLDAQRMAIIALVVQLGDSEGFLAAFRVLRQQVEADLLAENIPEGALDGISAESNAIEALLTRASS